MRRLFLPFLLGTLIAGVGGTQVLLAQQEEQDQPDVQEQAAPEQYEIIEVRPGRSGNVVKLGGMTLPKKMVNMAAQMPGDVEYIAGSEGDSFSKGAVLVKLDTSGLLAKRRQAVAQLASAEAGHRNAMVQYQQQVISPQGQSDNMLGGMPSMFSMFTDPMRSMTGQGSPGFERHSNLVGRGTQVQTAINQITQARAAIAELDESIENATSRAPFDGVIVKKMVEVGDIVQPGMPLVVYADTGVMQIQVEVPAGLASALREGQLIDAILDRGMRRIKVRVARVFPMAEQGGHTVTVKFDVPYSEQVKSGVYAEVLVEDRERNLQEALPVIPRSAIVWRGSLPQVFQVTEDGQIKMRSLRIGASAGNGEVSVITGVKAGDKILNNPSPSMRSGPMG